MNRMWHNLECCKCGNREHCLSARNVIKRYMNCRNCGDVFFAKPERVNPKSICYCCGKKLINGLCNICDVGIPLITVESKSEDKE